MDAWQWERSYAWARVFYVPPALDAGTQYSGPGRNCESESHTHRFPHRPESATQARTYALNFSSTSSLSAAERERRQQGSTRCVWLKLACNSSIHGHSQGHSQWRARAGRKPVGTAALNGQCTRGANTPSDHVRNGQQEKRGRQDNKKKKTSRPPKSAPSQQRNIRQTTRALPRARVCITDGHHVTEREALFWGLRP